MELNSAQALLLAGVSAGFVLFLVLDPLGNMPVFMSVLKDVDPARHSRIIIRELVLGLLILSLFLFLGRYLLHLLSLNQSSLSIAGGIILFFIAIKMIFWDEDAPLFRKGEGGEPLLVPLAIPLIAGPSAMATVMLYMARDPSHWFVWFFSLFIAWLVTGTILLLSGPISRLLGTRGLTAMQSLMGMILTTVAVQMLVDGVKQAFH